MLFRYSVCSSFSLRGTPPTVQEIAAQVRQTQAHILILDGFQGVRGGDTNHQIIRQMLYDWGTSLGLQGITILVTTEGTPRDPATFPEMTTSDVLIGLYFRLRGVRTLRAVEVIKARGSAPLLGQHGLALSDEGIHIFPRLKFRG